MERLKWMTLIVIGITVFLSIRVLGDYMYRPSHELKASNGVLDLRKEKFDERTIYLLDGQWDFYPLQLLTQSHIEQLKAPERLAVPGSWNAVMSKYVQGNAAFGYGTYHLRVLLPKIHGNNVALKQNNVRTAHELEVNGMLVHTSGKPAVNAQDAVAKNIPYVQTVTVDSDTMDIVIRASNYDMASSGGMLSVFIGSPEAIAHHDLIKLIWKVPLFSILALFFFMYLLSYFLQRRDWSKLYLAFFLLSYLVFQLSGSEKLLFQFMPFITMEWQYKITFLAMDGVIFSILFLRRVYAQYVPQWIAKGIIGLSIAYAGMVLFTPSTVYTSNYMVLTSVYLLCLIFWIYLFFKLIEKSAGEKWFYFWLLTSMCSYYVTRSFMFFGIIDESLSIPIEMYMMVIVIIFMQMKDYYKNYQKILALNEQLIVQDKYKDEFLANTSHELRTPVHAIMNVTKSMLRAQPQGKSAKQLLLIYEVTLRLSKLLNDITDFSKMKMGLLNLRYRNVELRGLIEHIREMTLYLIHDRPIQFHVRMEADSSVVWADEERLVQILLNLIQNAIHSMEVGDITLWIANDNDDVRFTVTDTGVGMSAEQLAALFGPLDGQETNQGIGLNVCKSLIEKMNGTMQVESEMDKGTTFIFTLPRAEEQQFVPQSIITDDRTISFAKERRKRIHEEPFKVLIIDDDATNLQILEDMLVENQYQVIKATSGEQALRIVEDVNHLQLVIVDLMLPDISGYQVCRTIRKRFTEIELPILIITARSQPDDLIAGFDVGANDFVLKPIGTDELLARVETLIGLKSAVDQKIAMEIAYRQAQITPHFLFNTLNSIAVLMQVDVEKSNDLLVEFSSYLRSSFQIQNIADFTSFQLEMDIVTAYLNIEQVRFPDMFEVIYDIPQGIAFDIPPLTLQPLVENAIRHGVRNRPPGRKGTIRMTVHPNDDGFVVEIADSGLGMSPQLITDVLSGKVQKGIGLRNIHLRLKQRFGSGLHIFTNEQSEFVVSFFVPLRS